MVCDHAAPGSGVQGCPDQPRGYEADIVSMQLCGPSVPPAILWNAGHNSAPSRHHYSLHTAACNTCPIIQIENSCFRNSWSLGEEGLTSHNTPKDGVLVVQVAG